jgi:uncharacterized protein YjbJ (UPF0337 family)
MMSQKTADYNRNPQIAMQKMPKAFFATDLQQATGNRQQATGNRQQATGNRQQATGNRQQATGNMQQATGNRQQATGNRQQATGNYTHLLTNRVNNPKAYIPIIFISSHFPMQYCPYRLYINCRADIKRTRSFL